ncbi:Signal transduction histidine kinase [[Clostridium] aminophilum]|uniref:Circadian input-output histidine kinase CikA n=1 Tax=[Clostridium] aminophilum TaxID=1526 RepID=A0A1I0ETQ0_9FIRM|nr:response regulator [[Clostridium] aminophilum]SET48941.1 Signal transduction histidine kinase [[Clostridium] aminophilum]
MEQRTYVVHDERDTYELLNNVDLEAKYLQANASVAIIYTNRVPRELITQVMRVLNRAYPKMIITGASQFGLLNFDSKFEAKVSFLFFDAADLASHIYELHESTLDDCIFQLRNILSQTKNLKGVQLFVNGDTLEISRFIREISDGFEDVAFFGTKANVFLDDMMKGEQPYIISNHKLISDGILAVTYSGENLNIMMDYRLGWTQLGRGMVATVDKDRPRQIGDTCLLSVDGKPAVELYERYLGVKNTPDFLLNINEFPLVLERGDTTIVRVPFYNGPEGELYFFGDIYDGEILRLGYGSSSALLHEADRGSKAVDEFCPEALLLYRCASRAGLLGVRESEEIKCYLRANIRLMSGTSSGEIYAWHGVCGVFSGAVVAVAMREGDRKDHDSEAMFQMLSFKEAEAGLTLADRLTNYLTTTTSELNEMARHAQAASEAKTAFLSNMSHEIRTPINAILGMDELILREENLPPKVREYANNIQEAGNTLLSLVNDVLDFSKIEAGKMEIIEEEYDFRTLMDDLDGLIRHRIESKGLKFYSQIDPRIPQNLIGDVMRTKQVLINLLTNSQKYTSVGTVLLRCAMKGGNGKELALNEAIENPTDLTLHFAVIDSGMGVKREDQAKLFESFERLDLKKNRRIQGTGLGLSIVKRILEKMNSRLEVKSVYGVGSIFYFDLPVRGYGKPIGSYAMNVNKKRKERHYQESFHATDASILVVDDAMMNLMVISDLLKKTGLHIDTASGGEECLLWMKRKTYDLVLLDYRMPDMDGIETLQHIRKMEPEYCRSVPVICLTANAIEGAREQYLEAGFNDYVPKPVKPDRLEEVVLQWLPKEKVEVVQRDITDSLNERTRELIDSENQKMFPPVPTWTFRVDEIDVMSGIRFCGSPEGFFTSLEILLKELERLREKFELMIYHREADDFSMQMHKLKSTASLAGADHLSRLAALLEAYHDTGDLKSMWEQAPAVLEMIDALQKDSYDAKVEMGFIQPENVPDPLIREEQADQGNTPEEEGAAQAEAEAELREITAALKTAIEIYDYDTALKNGEVLAEIVRNPELKELSKRFMDALDEFDWEQMGRLIRAMEEVYNSLERAGD